MTLRALTGGLLVGLLGLAALAITLGIEHHTLKQVHLFLDAHGELLPVSPHQAIYTLLVATVWLGVFFALLFAEVYPASTDAATAVQFSSLVWLAAVVPVSSLLFFWTALPRAGIAAIAAAWLLELFSGGLLLAWLLKQETSPTA